MEYAVELNNVWKVYGTGRARTVALRGVDLKIPRGIFVAIVGPSGSGKTTLLNIIGGLDKPSKGVVKVLGKDITRLSEDELAKFRRGRIGFVFQQFHLVSRLKVIENVEVPLMCMGVPPSRRKSIALRLLSMVGLKGKEYMYPGQLSGGEQQRVAIARALAYNPELVLADEPTGNLDTVNSRQIALIFRRLVDECKVTVIMATHDLDLLRYVDAKVMIRDGRVVSVEGPVKA